MVFEKMRDYRNAVLDLEEAAVALYLSLWPYGFMIG